MYGLTRMRIISLALTGIVVVARWWLGKKDGSIYAYIPCVESGSSLGCDVNNVPEAPISFHVESVNQ